MSPAGSLETPAEAAGQRLDRYLAEAIEQPRARVQRWIRAGRVRVDGRAVKPAHELAGGERLEWDPPPPVDDRLRPEPGELRILHEDPWLVVVDKPAGLAVHPGAGRPTGTLAHRLLARYPEIAGVGGPGRPGIVHRLDRGTTGVLAIARCDPAYRRLAADFAARRVEKRYLALVYGQPREPEGVIEAPIGRHPRRRKEMAVRPGGRSARTGYRTLAVAAGIALLELLLVTGRTHQIRVHLKNRGHPLIGDPTYGEARWKALPTRLRAPLRDFPRPALHAWRLGLRHPESGRKMEFTAPVPEDLRRLWEATTGEPLTAAR